MKLLKKVVASILVVSLVFASSANVFANSTSEEVSTEATFSDIENYLANAIMLNDQIDYIESENDITFDMRPEDFTQENFNFDNEWLENAKGFVQSYLNDFSTPSLRTAGQEPNTTQKAKANAVMYSIDRAKFSVSNDSSRNLNKEAQYMFVSHYIDRQTYYWESQDERYLFDGTTMSGESGYLADYLTATDRRAYDTYIGFTDFNTTFQHIGNLAEGIVSTGSTFAGINNGIKAVQEANTVLVIANGLTLQDDIPAVSNVLKEDVKPMFDQLKASFQDDPTVKMEDMYKRYINDENILEKYNEVDKVAILRTALSIIGSFVIAGPIGSIGIIGIALPALNFTVDIYTNIFKYTAWLALRTGFSGRYAERVMKYYGLG